MARATQIALFEREVRERLSRTALDLVLARAEVILRGAAQQPQRARRLLRIDHADDRSVPSLELLLRDACDAGTARRLAALLESDAEAGAHVEALASREAARVAGATPKAVRTARRHPRPGRQGLHRHRRRSDVLSMDDAMYSFAGAAKILGVPESKLRYWAQVGFVGPSVRRGGKPHYSFQDLVSVKAAKELVDRGFKAGKIRKAIEEVRATLPHVDRPLDRMRVAFDGTKLVVVDEGSAFESTGQKLFDFGLAELARWGAGPGPRAAAPMGSVERGSPSTSADAQGTKRQAYDWFVEGTRAELSNGGEGTPRAEQCYREALALDAGLAAARTNLGSLAYRRGDAAAAREAFEAALALDPDQPEARFNLANLVPRERRPRAGRGRAAARAADRARLRRRALQPGGRARTAGRSGRGARPPRALPVAGAGSDPLGRTGARAHPAARLNFRHAAVAHLGRDSRRRPRTRIARRTIGW